MNSNNKGHVSRVALQTKTTNSTSIRSEIAESSKHPFAPQVPEDQFGSHEPHNRDSEISLPDVDASSSNLLDQSFDGTVADNLSWATPRPLLGKIKPDPYPVVALPDTIRNAVEEVISFVKAPIPLVASAALSALSLAGQALIDVKRDERLQGPTGLFFLSIADSGERKSTCDGFFSEAIKTYQEEQTALFKPIIKEYKAMYAAWEAERSGLLNAIKTASKAKGNQAERLKALRAELMRLEKEEPEPPRVPRLLLADETPESLSWSLAKEWSSSGIVSSEAGIVFGSHGMSADSVTRNLGLLNILWDGGSKQVGRRTSERFEVRGARLTMALQIQGPTLQSFFERTGNLARGTGFLARFLIAWPESTQGTRFYTKAPESWPRLEAFNTRITAILNQPIQMDEDGALTPTVLPLEAEAKALWIEYSDDIEKELSSSGDYFDVRDVASKSADNAVRLAALFHLFEHGDSSQVCAKCFTRASVIAAWHLQEAMRFFSNLAIPIEIADAIKLERWLIDRCKRLQLDRLPTREVQREGPVRDPSRFNAALKELANGGYIRIFRDNRQKLIIVNPALVRSSG